MMAAANVQLPDSIVYDGFNLLPVLEGKRKSERKEMFWEFRDEFAARIDQWKWVRGKKHVGLFDLSRDPAEENDVSKDHPDVSLRIETAFKKWQQAMAEAEPRMPFKDF